MGYPWTAVLQGPAMPCHYNLWMATPETAVSGLAACSSLTAPLDTTWKNMIRHPHIAPPPLHHVGLVTRREILDIVANHLKSKSSSPILEYLSSTFWYFFGMTTGWFPLALLL
jgi:hypothetical protein